MKKNFLTFLFPLILTQLVAETITVSARVMDEKNNPLHNVNIYTETHGITTDENGLFELSVNKQEFITISHIGYEKILLKANEVGKIIYLLPISLRTEDIYVHSGLRTISLLEAASSVTIIRKNNITKESSNHFQGIIKSIPNLNWSGGTSRPRYFQIRGIGERSLYAGEGPPNFSVGFIIDDIDFSGIGMPGHLFDTGQIEVLRGPQSSIFGSNAMAGLINIRSVEPTSFFESTIQSTIANDNTKQLGIIINAPVFSNLNTRFSVFSNTSDGFRKNDYKNISNSNGRSELFFRNKSTWFPYSFVKCQLTALYSNQNNKYDVWSPDNNEKLITYSDHQGKDSQESSAFSLRCKLKNISDIDILSITSYSKNTLEHSYDGDWGNSVFWSKEPYNIQGWVYDYFDKNIRKRTTATEEIRIITDLGYRSSIIMGMYVKSLMEADDANGYLFGGDVSEYDGKFIVYNIASYFQYEQKILGNWAITLNTRFESNRTKYNGTSNNNGDNDTTITFDSNNEFAGFKSELKYNFNVNEKLYLSLSKGYKAGGINQNPYLSPVNRSYQPEYNWNYEIGYKLYTPKFQSQFTIFYMNRKNQQVNISSQQEEGNPNTFYFYTTNAATGYNFGLELEHSLNISDAFTIFHNLGYLNTNVDQYVYNTNETTIIRLGAREQAYAPKYTYSYGLLYKYPSGITLHCEVTGKDEFYFSDSHDMTSKKYQLLDVSIIYNYESFTISIWSKNLLDERYALRGFYFGLEPPNYEDKLYIHWGDPAQFGVSLKYQL